MGEWELARTFQDIADSDRTEYFAKEAELIGCGADTGKKLRAAIENHSDQVKMYTRFKDAAAANGDSAAAALFEKVVRDKDEQASRPRNGLAASGLRQFRSSGRSAGLGEELIYRNLSESELHRYRVREFAANGIRHGDRLSR